MQEYEKRIAFLYDCPYPFIKGGGEKRFYEIGRRLVKRGWNVDWYSMKAWNGPDEIDRAGIKYKAVMPRMNLYKPEGGRSIKEALSYGVAISKLAVLRNYKIIHCGQWPYFHLFAPRFYSVLSGGMLVIDWWEVWGNHWFDYLGYKGIAGIIVEKIASRLTSHLVTISELGRSQLASLSGLRLDDIHLINNGIDFEEIRRTANHPEFFDITYLGRLKNHKNIDHIIRAISILKNSKLTISLQIIGDGPERTVLERMSRELGVADQIRFWGEVDSNEDVYSHMKSSFLFANPSLKEGGGSITCLEANACGLPVLGYKSDLGISPELIQSAENGFLLEEADPSAIAMKIKELLGNTALLNHMKVSSVKFSREFDWDRIVDLYETVYEGKPSNGDIAQSHVCPKR